MCFSQRRIVREFYLKTVFGEKNSITFQSKIKQLIRKSPLNRLILFQQKKLSATIVTSLNRNVTSNFQQAFKVRF